MALPELAAEPSGGFLVRFGLDPWLLLAQGVNFLVVLLVLSRFVFRPLLKNLKERSKEIARGIADAQAAERARAEAEQSREEILLKANAEAAALRRAAEEEGHRLRDAVVRRAEEEAAAMHDAAEQEAGSLRRAAVREASGDVAELVVEVSERVLGARLTAPARAAYRDAALADLKRRNA